MNPLHAKYFNCLTPTVATTSGWSSTDSAQPIDTAGANYCEVIVNLAMTAGASLANFSLQEGDTTASFTNITGLVVGTAYQFGGTGAISVLHTTAYNGVTVFGVDLKGRKRYLMPKLAASTSGTQLSIVARLSRLDVSPSTNTSYGTAELLSVPHNT